ncbi:cytochrome P450 [Setomelanomma holmii]|uniref:Cytochrome P450 n=1 Tax=Setomelanomma holmii TaxID=210430 RepID=A0A9P4HAY0_9PLEO|nr:cytochrome P450 [Setomelanomma holmii]
MNWNDSEVGILAGLKHHILFQVCVAFVAVCVCTRILSSQWFQQIKHSRATNVTPPTLPYWIPFLRHALQMAWDTQRFTARVLNKYGDGTPFFINAAGRKILVLLDSAQIKRVMAASKELDPNPFIHEMILGQMLGSPEETIEFYKNDDGQMDHVQMKHIRQWVTGTSLISMSKKVYERLNVNIGKEVLQNSDAEWLEIPDLFAFVQDHVTVAITETTMGTDITEQYPKMTEDQWTFMDRSIEMVTGLPRFIIPTAYNARDRLLESIKKWSRKSEALRTAGKADPFWDASAGSGLMQERQERYAKSDGFNEDARASQVLGLLFGVNSLTPPMTFWYLFETLRDPSLFQKVSTEIRNHFDAKTSSYDFMQLTVRPILQSLHAETTRFYSSNVAVRVVTSPAFALDDKYTITKGTTLFIYNKFAGLFTPGWHDARPHTTTKPLDTFWAERFLHSREGKRERFMDAGLGGSWTSFGGGEHKCPGRHFARNIGIVGLAVLLGNFECDLSITESLDDFVPKIRETAFGKMEPTRKVTARLRRRQR